MERKDEICVVVYHDAYLQNFINFIFISPSRGLERDSVSDL